MQQNAGFQRQGDICRKYMKACRQAWYQPMLVYILTNL